MSTKPKFFRRVIHESPWLPDFIASSVVEIDVRLLNELGIQAMLLDIDDTLMERRGDAFDAHIVTHLKHIHDAGIELVIGSNTNRDIRELAASIRARIVDKKRWHFKPMKHFFHRILATIDAPPDRIVMVGDRVVNDVVGANRSGVKTILVTPVEREPSRHSHLYRAYLMDHSIEVTS